jgi:acetoin utilization protein AcuB
MLVKYWMSMPAITVDADARVTDAVARFARHGIRQMPVVKGQRVEGMLYEADLTMAALSGRQRQPLAELPAAGFMRADVGSVSEDLTVEEAAHRMTAKRAGGLSVVDHRQRLAGIITRSDILRVLVGLTGARRQGIQYGIIVPDRPGSVGELTERIRFHGGRLASILTLSEGAPEGFRHAYIRIYGIDRFRLQSLNEALKASATVIYVKDKPEIRRESP